MGLNGVDCNIALSLKWTFDWYMVQSLQPYPYKIYGSCEHVSPSLLDKCSPSPFHAKSKNHPTTDHLTLEHLTLDHLATHSICGMFIQGNCTHPKWFYQNISLVALAKQGGILLP